MSQPVRRDWTVRASESAAVGAAIKVSGAISARGDAGFGCLALLRCPCGLYLYCRVSCGTEENPCSVRLQTGEPGADAPGFALSPGHGEESLWASYAAGAFLPWSDGGCLRRRRRVSALECRARCRRSSERGFPPLLLQPLRCFTGQRLMAGCAASKCRTPACGRVQRQTGPPEGPAVLVSFRAIRFQVP